MNQTDDTYNTIDAPSKGIIKEKGSKFLSFAYPVNSEEEIKSVITLLKKEYFDARHHCYAWALGAKREQYRTFDDGEPSGTAGKPIYGQILSFNITNTLIVVVRYFGGTLLGTGGLTQAYKQASADALQNAKLVEKTVGQTITFNFNYLVMNNIMRILKEENLELVNQAFDNECTVSIIVRNSRIEQVTNKLKEIESVKIDEN